MPTESKSETPRSHAIADAINATLKPYAEQYFSTATAMLLIGQFLEIAKIETELNEAHKNCIKQLDWEQLREERNTLAKENKVMRDALQKCDWLGDDDTSFRQFGIVAQGGRLREVRKIACSALAEIAVMLSIKH